MWWHRVVVGGDVVGAPMGSWGVGGGMVGSWWHQGALMGTWGCLWGLDWWH